MNDNVISEMGMTGGDMGLGKKIDLESLPAIHLCEIRLDIQFGV